MISHFKKGERLEFFEIFDLLIKNVSKENFKGEDLKLRTNMELYFLVYEIHPYG